jgi:hypothetical protein
VFRVLVSFLSTVSRDLTHERSLRIPEYRLDGPAVFLGLESEVWYGTVKRLWETALFSLPVLSFLPRQGSRLHAIADRKPVLPGRGCLHICVRAARFVAVGLDMRVDGGWLLLHDLVRGVRDFLAGSRESRSWSGTELVLSRVRDCW